MKRKILLLASLILSALPISLSAQMTYVPDDNFEQALIDKGYDTPPLNDSVPTKNIDTISILWISNKYITDLTGIEDFNSLEELHCCYNELTKLDVSKNTRLTQLCCIFNYLKILNVTNCSSLKYLDCFDNKLTSLDVSNCSALEKLNCFSNLLTSLDVSLNSVIKDLSCNINKLTSLNVSNNPSLFWLDCSSNQLTNLDICKISALQYLYCNYNQLTSLDLSSNLDLRILKCQRNSLSSLDFSKNSKLSTLYCDYNQLSGLDLSKNPELSSLICSNNQLTILNIKNGNNLRGPSGHPDVMFSYRNPNLLCIQVDNVDWSEGQKYWKKDSTAHYSENCNYTAVEDNKFENEAAAISPNPAQDYIELSYPPRPPGEGWGEGIRIYNILGEIVSGLDTPLDPLFLEGGKCRINISALPQGTYFVRIGGEIKKFIKF